MTELPERRKGEPWLVATDALGQTDLFGWEGGIFLDGQRLLIPAMAWVWGKSQTLHYAINPLLSARDWTVTRGQTLCRRKLAGRQGWLGWLFALPEGYQPLTALPSEFTLCRTCANAMYRLSRAMAANQQLLAARSGSVPILPVQWPADPRWTAANSQDGLSDEAGDEDDDEALPELDLPENAGEDNGLPQA